MNWNSEELNSIVFKFYDNDYYTRFCVVGKIVSSFIKKYKGPLDGKTKKYFESLHDFEKVLYKDDYYTKYDLSTLIWKSFNLVNEYIYKRDNKYMPFDIVENMSLSEFHDQKDSDMMFIDLRSKTVII